MGWVNDEQGVQELKLFVCLDPLKHNVKPNELAKCILRLIMRYRLNSKRSYHAQAEK